MYSGIPIKASKRPDEFSELPTEGEFRKRDVDVFNRPGADLFGYFKEVDAIYQTGFDDDANVHFWTWEHDVRDFLQDNFAE